MIHPVLGDYLTGELWQITDQIWFNRFLYGGPQVPKSVEFLVLSWHL